MTPSGLYHSDFWIGEEAHRTNEKVALRNEIGVEYRDEFSIRLGQGVIDIASLGIGIIRPCEIANSLSLAERLQPGPPAIVERPDAEVRIVKAERARDRFLQDFEGFIESRNVDVDRGESVGGRCPQTRLVPIRFGVAIGGS